MRPLILLAVALLGLITVWLVSFSSPVPLGAGMTPGGSGWGLSEAERSAAARPGASEERDSTMETVKTATFGAGCFWGVEEAFRVLPGVISTEVGYTGGETDTPTYQQVCTDTTGHAEAVRVQFDPEQTTYAALLDTFWDCHNPTQKNRQGPDVGRQYRSVIFYYTAEQKQAAEAARDALEKTEYYAAPIATEIVEAAPFWLAEEYHQKYLLKRGKGACHL